MKNYLSVYDLIIVCYYVNNVTNLNLKYILAARTRKAEK